MGARILLFSLVLLLFGGMYPGAKTSNGAGGPRGDTVRSPSPNGATSDTIYVARMGPLIVTAYRIDQTYTGTLANAGRAGGGGPATVSAGAASPAADSEDVAPDGVLVGGLIVNETFSVIGARFAQAFNDKWTEPEEARDIGYTITLGENPAPRRGAQVFVDVEGQMLFQTYLRPNRRQIQQAARRAVQRATLYVRKYYEPREVY